MTNMNFKTVQIPIETYKKALEEKKRCEELIDGIAKVAIGSVIAYGFIKWIESLDHRRRR